MKDLENKNTTKVKFVLTLELEVNKQLQCRFNDYGEGMPSLYQDVTICGFKFGKEHGTIKALIEYNTGERLWVELSKLYINEKSLVNYINFKGQFK